MKRHFTALAVCFFAILSAQAQSRKLTLDEAISIARKNSVEAAVALNQLKTAYWLYRTYRAQFLPEVGFSASMPSYAKSYSAYQLDNGSYTYVRNNYLSLNGTLSVSQSLPFTGGRVSLQTSLDFMRQLGEGASSRYMSIPVAITLSQPIFGLNTYKWDRRIEPVRYREAQARFLEATENVAMNAIYYYFDLLTAECNLKVAKQNHENASRLVEVARVRRDMGQISKNDSLQMELNLLEAKSSMTAAESNYKSAMFNLRSFLGFDDDMPIEAQIPEMVDVAIVDHDTALAKALENNDFSLNIRRRQLEAEYSVAKAKAETKQITLFAQVGYTGTGASFVDAYNPLKDNQIVQVGVQIPILDWGKRSGRIKVAESNRQVVEAQIRQENINFRQDLFILVERFNNQQQQVMIAAQADDIATRRYITNVETYAMGRISTLDLNDSQMRKDEAKSRFISQLYQYWRYYYQLRSITLWDFAKNADIDADFDKIVE